MTQTFAVNENNDIFIGTDGNMVVANGLQAVLFACASAAKAQRGEMSLAITRGMPNFEAIWNGNPNIAQFETALRQTILGVDGVINIVSLSTSLSADVLSYTVTILTQYGRGVVNGSL